MVTFADNGNVLIRAGKMKRVMARDSYLEHLLLKCWFGRYDISDSLLYFSIMISLSHTSSIRQVSQIRLGCIFDGIFCSTARPTAYRDIVVYLASGVYVHRIRNLLSSNFAACETVTTIDWYFKRVFLKEHCPMLIIIGSIITMQRSQNVRPTNERFRVTGITLMHYVHFGTLS